ncbi:MAG: hypothetical protein AAB227_11200 [Pseudomonadota bacterium]
MQLESRLLRGLSPTVADAPDAGDDWAKSPVSSLSDAALIEAAAGAISPPKASAQSSFLLHAPLELAARAALLPMVAPSARDQARRRIAAIAARYAGEGDEIGAHPGNFQSAPAALSALAAAIKDGDAGGADAALLFLIPRISVLDLRAALAPKALPMLGAAAHIPIYLAELSRLEARLAPAAALLRAPLRHLVGQSQLKLRWQEDAQAPSPVRDEGEALFEALLAPPHVNSSSVYIAPTMLAVEANGFAERTLADATANLSLRAARRAVSRIAALSMLQDDPEHAPYGWSHALSMPEGVFGCADAVEDKTMLLRIAATHALGFRATLGKARLRDAPPPKPNSDAIVDVAPIEAAGAVYHMEAARLPCIKTALATRAATGEDAHLAKYTLACFDAAARDAGSARLFLAAAAYLGAWWDAHRGVSFE